ncbi:hypothetical protein L218DRAFT_252094 [Marasmius fiardii PR-910]|nr:hypothetical protein L218DRAFT_252094 [Marasmius fiardii PR-910]
MYQAQLVLLASEPVLDSESLTALGRPLQDPLMGANNGEYALCDFRALMQPPAGLASAAKFASTKPVFRPCLDRVISQSTLYPYYLF